MSYIAEVVADSIANGVRLTTMKVRYPHGVHKDMLRHREQSPVYESFRAQKPEDIIAELRSGGAFKPEVFGKRIPGMGQRNEAIEGEEAVDQERMSVLWDDHVLGLIELAEVFLEVDIAKQQVNFLLQDVSFITGLITATSWSNFFALRLELKPDGSPMARPEVYKIASMMRDAMDASDPVVLGPGEWHLPLVRDAEVIQDLDAASGAAHEEAMWRWWAMVSAGRCARVSYARQDEYEVPAKSFVRAERLLRNGHMSPFEQQARPLTDGDIYCWPGVNYDLRSRLTINLTDARRFADRTLRPDQVSCGNFRAWAQHRKFFACEQDYGLLKETLELAT